MIHEIEINDELNLILARVAGENGLSAAAYAQNIVTGWLEGQYRGDVLREIEKRSIDEIKEIKTVLDNQLLKPKT